MIQIFILIFIIIIYFCIYKLSKSTSIYISLTSIFKNQDILCQTLQSILQQTMKPNKIFVHLSEEEYILDTGFKDKQITSKKLYSLIHYNPMIKIVWVKNTGPYRKLLPLLKNKWKENCFIITIDDDQIYDKNLIKHLIKDYKLYKCCIGYRGFTPDMKTLQDFDYQKRKKLNPCSLYNFLTGVGSVLYKPEFFYKTKHILFEEHIYMSICPKQDDIWFYILRIMNNIKCYVGNKNWSMKDLTDNGLYCQFNSKNNNNTVIFKNILERLNLS